MSKIDSIALANYIITQLGSIHLIKLEILIFYIEAWHLAKFDDPFIEDCFLAWTHGPISQKVMDHFKSDLFNKGISVPDTFSSEKIISDVETLLTQEALSLVKYVLDKYGQKSPQELESFIKQDVFWRDLHQNIDSKGKSSRIIDKEKMRKYYRKMFENMTL